MGEFSVKERRELGKKIREYKERTFPERGSGIEIASRLGVTPQRLSQWMGGIKEPTPMQLHQLANLFSVTIQELCDRPKVKKSRGKTPGLDLIMEITEKYKNIGSKKITKKHDQQFMQEIKSVMNLELVDLL